jgi:YidC/Oxa1 family membrane protein insertase
LDFVFLAQTTNFILKPLAWVLSFVIDLIYNGVVAMTTTQALGITVILFTLIMRVILFPLSLKQQRSSRKMQRLQPKIQRIQDKYKNKTDPESSRMMQMEMQDLYKENKTSPFSGCLPMLIQFPIIFVLFEILRNLAFYITDYGAYFDTLATQVMNIAEYQTLLQDNFAEVIKQIQKFDITTFDSIKDLLAHFTSENWTQLYELIPALANNAQFTDIVDTTQKLNSFIGFNLTESGSLGFPDIIWPLLAGGTTWLQSWLMNKANEKRTIAAGGDPKKNSSNQTMKTMNVVMPLMTAFFVITMPLGIGLYWIAGNIFSILQQLLIDVIVDKEEYKQAVERKRELEEKRRLKEIARSNIDKKTGKRIGTAETAMNRSSMAGNRKAAANKRVENSKDFAEKAIQNQSQPENTSDNADA